MSEAQNIFLTVVTENQKQIIKAEKLSELLKNELGNDWEIQSIEKYDKFEGSYRIDLKLTIHEIRPEVINHLAITLTDKIVSPWLLFFDKDENSIELIYNKDSHTQNRKIDFNVIKWGQLQITRI